MTGDNRGPNFIDIHVGKRLRLRRKSLGLSQSDLARALGMTFQQVQKYERGNNRVSASKLFESAEFLKVTVGYFFEDIPSGHAEEPDVGSDVEEQVPADLRTEEDADLVREFGAISDHELRRHLMAVVKALAAGSLPRLDAGTGQ